MGQASGILVLPRVAGIRQFAEEMKARWTTGASFTQDEHWVLEGRFNSISLFCFKHTTIDDIIHAYEKARRLIEDALWYDI